LNTAATQELVNVMNTHTGISSTQITNDKILGHPSVDRFVVGLKAAGSHPSPSEFVDSMLTISSYNGAGLYGAHSMGSPWTKGVTARWAPTMASGWCNRPAPPSTW
jgi:hypothetical protein